TRTSTTIRLPRRLRPPTPRLPPRTGTGTGTAPATRRRATMAPATTASPATGTAKERTRASSVPRPRERGRRCRPRAHTVDDRHDDLRGARPAGHVDPHAHPLRPQRLLEPVRAAGLRRREPRLGRRLADVRTVAPLV